MIINDLDDNFLAKKRQGKECEEFIKNKVARALFLAVGINDVEYAKKWVLDATNFQRSWGEVNAKHVFEMLELDPLVRDDFPAEFWEHVVPSWQGSFLCRAKEFLEKGYALDTDPPVTLSSGGDRPSHEWLQCKGRRIFAWVILSVALEWWNQRKAAEEKPANTRPDQAQSDPTTAAGNGDTPNGQDEHEEEIQRCIGSTLFRATERSGSLEKERDLPDILIYWPALGEPWARTVAPWNDDELKRIIGQVISEAKRYPLADYTGSVLKWIRNNCNSANISDETEKPAWKRFLRAALQIVNNLLRDQEFDDWRPEIRETITTLNGALPDADATTQAIPAISSQNELSPEEWRAMWEEHAQVAQTIEFQVAFTIEIAKKKDSTGRITGIDPQALCWSDFDPTDPEYIKEFFTEFFQQDYGIASTLLKANCDASQIFLGEEKKRWRSFLRTILELMRELLGDPNHDHDWDIDINETINDVEKALGIDPVTTVEAQGTTLAEDAGNTSAKPGRPPKDKEFKELHDYLLGGGKVTHQLAIDKGYSGSTKNLKKSYRDACFRRGIEPAI